MCLRIIDIHALIQDVHGQGKSKISLRSVNFDISQVILHSQQKVRETE